MNALSIQQPWADLIVLGMKDIENRTWKTNYRGPLLIHAPLQIDKDGELWLRFNPCFQEEMNTLSDMIGHGCRRGFIIGSVDLVDCVKHHSSKWFGGPYGFVLANPIMFKNATPYSGRLMIFTVPDEVMR
jgi:hypothetical protein